MVPIRIQKGATQINSFIGFATQRSRGSDGPAFRALIEAVTQGKHESQSLDRAWIPESISIVNAGYCQGSGSISCESNSQLTQIESHAFSKSSLEPIVIPMSADILGSFCFSDCTSLSSISFGSNSRLTRLESNAFDNSSLESVVIPRSPDVPASTGWLWVFLVLLVGFFFVGLLGLGDRFFVKK
jgi:hypothetical protein